MDRITAQDSDAQSADIKANNIAQLRALFPELITDGAEGAAVNVDVLKQLVGDATLTDAEGRVQVRSAPRLKDLSNWCCGVWKPNRFRGRWLSLSSIA